MRPAMESGAAVSDDGEHVGGSGGGPSGIAALPSAGPENRLTGSLPLPRQKTSGGPGIRGRRLFNDRENHGE